MKDNRPLAGRFSEIGEQIFSLGNRKANLITTGPWNEILMLENEAQKIKFEKSFPQHPQQKKYEQADNHSYFHKVYVPPIYMTSANAKYCGSPSRSPVPNTERLYQTNVTPKINKTT